MILASLGNVFLDTLRIWFDRIRDRENETLTTELDPVCFWVAALGSHTPLAVLVTSKSSVCSIKRKSVNRYWRTNHWPFSDLSCYTSASWGNWIQFRVSLCLLPNVAFSPLWPWHIISEERQSVCGTAIKTLVIDVVHSDKWKSHFSMDKYSVGGESE